jgi:nucleoside-diphosphate-sugar epimerase
VSKVLIVGGAGYVGGYLTDELIELGETVTVYDNLTYEDMYLKQVEFICGDILDYSKINKIFNRFDVVVWLAALVGDPACAINPNLTLKTNSEAVGNLARNFHGKIIFPSTCSVYGAQDELLDENSPTRPLSLYAESKIQAETTLLQHDSSRILIFRLGTLFGISDQHARLRVDLVLNLLTIRAVLEGEMSVFGGLQYRPLLHVRDVTTAILPQMRNDTSGVYNLGCENVTIADLATRISNLVPGSSVKFSELSFQDSRNYKVSTEKAKSVLNFQSKFSVEDGIKEVALAVTTGRIKNVNNPRYSNSEALKIQLRT